MMIGRSPLTAMVRPNQPCYEGPIAQASVKTTLHSGLRSRRKMKVAFAGLGVMGFPMAGHLAKAGHEMAVFNRSPEKAAHWVETHGGRAGATAAEAAEGAELFILCVGNDGDVRQVVVEALPVLAPGAVVVDP